MIIRESTSKDKAFITSTWYQSYYPKSNLPFDDYKYYQNRLMKSLLENSTILIACDDTDTTQIFGWLVYMNVLNEPVIHYCYVKTIYRRFGAAKALMTRALEDNETFLYTHEPEEKKILSSLTFASGEFCEHLRYKEFYEET
jgi:hypothetical protein